MSQLTLYNAARRVSDPPNSSRRKEVETRNLTDAPAEQTKITQTGVLMEHETPREGTRPAPRARTVQR